MPFSLHLCRNKKNDVEYIQCYISTRVEKQTTLNGMIQCHFFIVYTYTLARKKIH